MHWSVSVERDGENVVTLSSNCLSGRDLSAEDEEAIRTAAQHLLAFVGAAAPDVWEQRARQLAWLGHGCFGAGLYGDDGEMQCNNTDRHRPLDFKRESWDALNAEMLRAAVSGAAAGRTP